jgi:hypothetical protein
MQMLRIVPRRNRVLTRTISHRRRFAAWTSGVLVLILMLGACATPTPEGGREPPDQYPSGGSGATATPVPKPAETEPTATDAPAAIDPGIWDLGGAVLDDVISISDGETAGPILTVRVTNPTSASIEVIIPCGLIFQPDDDTGEQRLMVIQTVSITLTAGETGELTPYVVCIDADRSVPGDGTAYYVGSLASGDLLTLAQCICLESLTTDFEEDPMGAMEAMSVQFAIWSAAGGINLDSLSESLEDAEGALGAVGQSDFMGEFEGMLGEFSEFFNMMGYDWLEKCGIEIETE